MSDVLAFNVNGTPAPQGSKKGFATKKGGQYTGKVSMSESSKKVKPWRAAVADAAKVAIENVMTFDDWEPYAGPVRVTIRIRIQRPKHHYRTGRYSHLLRDNAPDFVITTPDTDKVCRSTFDALTEAGVIIDDRIIAQLDASKVYCDRTDPAGAYISVSLLERPAQAVA